MQAPACAVKSTMCKIINIDGNQNIEDSSESRNILAVSMSERVLEIDISKDLNPSLQVGFHGRQSTMNV